MMDLAFSRSRTIELSKKITELRMLCFKNCIIHTFLIMFNIKMLKLFSCDYKVAICESVSL